jgi:hypothetical protein
VATVVPPRLKMIRDKDGIEPVAFSRDAEAQEIRWAELLSRCLVAQS